MHTFGGCMRVTSVIMASKSIAALHERFLNPNLFSRMPVLRNEMTDPKVRQFGLQLQSNKRSVASGRVGLAAQ